MLPSSNSFAGMSAEHITRMNSIVPTISDASHSFATLDIGGESCPHRSITAYSPLQRRRHPKTLGRLVAAWNPGPRPACVRDSNDDLEVTILRSKDDWRKVIVRNPGRLSRKGVLAQ